MPDAGHDDGLRANPYVGLRPFFAEDALYFYGRDKQTAELLDILRANRFVGVVGSSGCGKSSLVRAGLLPALLGGFLVGDRDRWRFVQVKPGDAPLTNLATGLAEALGDGPDTVPALEAAIRADHVDGLVTFLDARLAGANLLVLVDQFEELFAFRGDADGDAAVHDPEQARRRAESIDYVDLLLRLAARPGMPIYVAITMRTDFLGDCDLFLGLPEALNRGRYLVPRLTRDELRDAIECPAVLCGQTVAPRLTDRVLNDLGDRSDRLPVVQHALLRTWDEWARASIGPLDTPHFDAAGGLEGALAQDAEHAMAGLDAGVVERIFKRLTGTDVQQRRIRTPARMSELMAVSGASRAAVEAVVAKFEGDGRSFLHASADGQAGDPRVDISHESLIRQWPRLRDWVDAERAARDALADLVQRARKHASGAAALLVNPELAIATNWRRTVAPTSDWAARYCSSPEDFTTASAYLDASDTQRREQSIETQLRRRWRTVWGRLLLTVELIAGLALAFQLDLFKKIADIGRRKPAEEGVAGEVVGRFEQIVTDFQGFLNSGDFILFVAFVIASMLVNHFGRLAYRRAARPRLERADAAAGGGLAIPDLRPAEIVHATTYATFVRRAAGLMIDSFILCVLMFVAIVPVLIFQDDLSDTAEIYVFLAVLLAGTWAYSVIGATGRRGATLGQRVVGVFRTGLNGERVSVSQASAMFGYRFMSTLLWGLGFLMQPLSARRQTFHDYMAGTVVLRRASEADAVVVDGPDASMVCTGARFAWTRQRIAGFGIDLLILGGILMSLMIGGYAEVDVEDDTAFAEASGSILLATIAFAWLYATATMASPWAASFGQRAVGIYRARLDGSRPGFLRANLMWLARLLSYISLGLGFAMALRGGRRQTFHDWASGTVVLQGRPGQPGRQSSEGRDPVAFHAGKVEFVG